MSKIKNNDLYFIHIPKNAGTSFIEDLCEFQTGHHSIREIPNILWDKTIAITRNPYDRLLSLYNYIKMKKNYWLSDDNTTMFPLHELHEYAINTSFKNFVKDVYNGKFKDKVHFLPQTHWLFTHDKKIVTKLFKIKNLDKQLSEFFGYNVSLSVINNGPRKNNEYDAETLDMVYETYKEDFIHLGYNVSYSQYGQEDFIINLFNNKKGLTFFEAGGMDGIRYSNTWKLENLLGWNGLIVEPSPIFYKELVKNRSCICENVLLGEGNIDKTYLHIIENDTFKAGAGLSGVLENYSTIHNDRVFTEIDTYKASYEKINMKTIPLQELLDKHNIHVIDFFSLDTEGSESEILKSIDFEKTQINILNIEFNEYNDELYNFILSKGYTFIKKIHCDYIFKNNNFN